ncbi:Hypothetical predicted protein [Podarcis lilfordi]|uniref:Uncharacterized protein n=1 Tax=Podarcis lilfordi TaxID=74358 RepID=A0AA35PB24_9SAUR|nr:Hypothetical predicted protein [Podarcis lilfordi]
MTGVRAGRRSARMVPDPGLRSDIRCMREGRPGGSCCRHPRETDEAYGENEGERNTELLWRHLFVGFYPCPANHYFQLWNRLLMMKRWQHK